MNVTTFHTPLFVKKRGIFFTKTTKASFYSTKESFYIAFYKKSI